jgi:hypothetical protein
LYEGKLIMARTTFSGPVYSGNPDNINDNTSGTTAYGFYTRVEIGSATGTSFGSSSYQTPGEAYGVFGRTQGGAPFSTTPTTTFNQVAGVAGNFAVIGTYANNALMAGVLGIINTNTLSGDAAVMAFSCKVTQVRHYVALLSVLQWLRQLRLQALHTVLT